MLAIRRCSTLLIVLCGLSPMTVHATCDPTTVSTARASVEAQCDCAGAADRRSYVACVRTAIRSAMGQGLSTTCAAAVKRCLTHSTCGKPGYVTCLTTSAGHLRCRLKRSASVCTAAAGACVGTTPYCCDADEGCAPPSTTSTSSTSTTSTEPPASTTSTEPVPTTTTSTTLPPVVCADPDLALPPIGQVPITIVAGTTDCGGAALSPPPAPPLSGEIDDGTGTKLGDLGTGCLYVGAGNNFLIPGGRIPDGSTMILNVTGVQGTAATLGPSAGTGPKDCTLGPLDTRHCVSGDPGTDGHGACTADTDCGIQVGGTNAVAGVCARDVRCYFGPPLPLPVPIFPAFSACIVSVFDQGACGVSDLVSQSTTFSAGVLARVFITANGDEPCPRCVGGMCDGGQNVGNACTPVGSAGTSVDCPPESDFYDGTISVVLQDATTGTRTADAADGLFCPGQTSPGAFGIPAATHIATHGSPLNPTGLLSNTALATVAAPFCIPPTNVPILDAAEGFPAPAAVSVPVRIDLTDLIGLGLPHLP